MKILKKRGDKSMEDMLMEDMLDLLKWLLKIREPEEYIPPNYYKLTINSLENVAKSIKKKLADIRKY